MIYSIRMAFRLLRRALLIPGKLSEEKCTNIIVRFLCSAHVADLKFIFISSTVVFLIYALTVCSIMITYRAWSLVTYIGAGIPIYFGIAAWVFLSTYKRLGVIDLFSPEISHLCSVCASLDVGNRYVEAYRASEVCNDRLAAVWDRSMPSADSVSQSDYRPIFDHNSKDLSILSARVARNIVDFYGYLEAVREIQHRLATMRSIEPGLVRSILADLIYVLFRACESGRKAIEDMIEFAPARVEAEIGILLTELVCYPFLCEYFRCDPSRFADLKLREYDYKRMVPALLRTVISEHEVGDRNWVRAESLVPELAKRYDRAFGENISQFLKSM